MRSLTRLWLVLLLPTCAAQLLAETPDADPPPLLLSVLEDPETLFDPYGRAAGAPEGGAVRPVALDLGLTYSNRHMFRGIDRFQSATPGNRTNLQIDAALSLDLSPGPTLFAGGAMLLTDSDELSRLLEIRPTVGLRWTLGPVLAELQHTSFIYPERRSQDTSEAALLLEFDIAELLNADLPCFAPFVLAAYDYDCHNGWYAEVGIVHRGRIGDTGLSVEFRALAAYVDDYDLLAGRGGISSSTPDTGWQRWQVNLTVAYPLNTLLNIPASAGSLSIAAHIAYTDALDPDLHADTQLWGGLSLTWRY